MVKVARNNRAAAARRQRPTRESRLMSILYLVRHARPSAGWGDDPDPGLDATGHEQAAAIAATLDRRIASLPIWTSPLRRCRETAASLEQLWGRSALVVDIYAELPSPALHLKARHEWLRAGMAGTWEQLHRSAPAGSPDYLAWRRDLLAALLAAHEDAVVYTHFLAINVAVGAALGRDDVLCFRPDHASMTCIDTTGGALRVVELGREAHTGVLTGKA